MKCFVEREKLTGNIKNIGNSKFKFIGIRVDIIIYKNLIIFAKYLI